MVKNKYSFMYSDFPLRFESIQEGEKELSYVRLLSEANKKNEG